MTATGRPRCVILGGGGHARVVIDAIQVAGLVDVAGVLDANPERWGTELLGIPVLGGDEQLVEIARTADHFAVGLGSVGDSGPRRRLFEAARAAGLAPFTVRHPSAIVSPMATVGAGSQLLPRCVVNAGAAVGINVIVNTGAIVEHDCVIGDHAHVATGAILASTVTVGEGAHVGAGAVVRQGIHIGAGALVGAGAVVVKDVPAGAVVMGVPARLRPSANRGGR